MNDANEEQKVSGFKSAETSLQKVHDTIGEVMEVVVVEKPMLARLLFPHVSSLFIFSHEVGFDVVGDFDFSFGNETARLHIDGQD